ncbi:DeoR/GlpR family DNA-binding transcription regulator [Vibrio fluvialis]|uniref:DeoR/GlpR family DNA-binding transcription regulator n=1 Tax=Vibrio fluvialis TaxID=676 RepID=UPI001F2866ED|nr:DeoR/GlpR family DNA-binding transcription regulator [Vibrio fluvialis]MCE7658278.1 DeoR/GlpR family DNA-binding transcription regulator [Vibrio fluvialis]
MNKCIAEQRQRILLDMLAAEGSLNATEVAERLNTTGATVRRDLNKLAEMGLCKRTHGGAIVLTPANGSVDERQSQHALEKQSLATTALSLLKPNQLIFIDASSTNMALADRMPQDLNLTVVTNSIHIAMSLYNRGAINTILIGGQIDAAIGGAVDAKALADVQMFHFDLMFIGVCAWSQEHGFTALHYPDAQFKRQLLKQSGAKVVLFTPDKVETYAPFSLMATTDVDYLVCDGASTPDNLTRTLVECGAHILDSRAGDEQQ